MVIDLCPSSAGWENRRTPPGPLLPLRKAAVLKGRWQHRDDPIKLAVYQFYGICGNLRLIVLSIIALGVAFNGSVRDHFSCITVILHGKLRMSRNYNDLLFAVIVRRRYFSETAPENRTRVQGRSLLHESEEERTG